MQPHTPFHALEIYIEGDLYSDVSNSAGEGNVAPMIRILTAPFCAVVDDFVHLPWVILLLGLALLLLFQILLRHLHHLISSEGDVSVALRKKY